MITDILKVISPFDNKTVTKLTVGTAVLISGTVYVARDAAHKRMAEALKNRESLPFDIRGQTIYYMGPSPAKSGNIIGSAGPTTSARMDIFTPSLLSAGLRAMIGKGSRAPEIREAIKKYRGLYMVTTGGASALLSKTIKKVELVAYQELGTEAILLITLEDFPAIVANDIYGADLFEQGKVKYHLTK
jgi:fumarate hydratase subunit beta